MAKTVIEMLKEFGQDIILRQVAIGGVSYDPNTGAAAAAGGLGEYDAVRRGLPTDQPGNRIGPEYGQTLQGGTLVQDSDKWMYLDASGSKPTLSDLIIYQNVVYSLISVQETNPGGIPLLYLVVMRA